jgi:hypothetical protein
VEFEINMKSKAVLPAFLIHNLHNAWKKIKKLLYHSENLLLELHNWIYVGNSRENFVRKNSRSWKSTFLVVNVEKIAILLRRFTPLGSWILYLQKLHPFSKIPSPRLIFKFLLQIFCNLSINLQILSAFLPRKSGRSWNLKTGRHIIPLFLSYDWFNLQTSSDNRKKRIIRSINLSKKRANKNKNEADRHQLITRGSEKQKELR